MFCFHKYDKVEADGFQYCKKCGKATKPEIPTIKCQHDWKEVQRFDITEPTFHGKGIYKGIKIWYKCSICGDTKLDDFTV